MAVEINRTLYELIDSNLQFDEASEAQFEKARTDRIESGSGEFCIRTLPKETAYDDEPVKAVYLVALKNVDIRRLDVRHKIFSFDGVGTSVSQFMGDYNNIIDGIDFESLDFNGPYHQSTDRGTRLDMNLRSSGGLSIIVFWSVSDGVRFGSSVYDELGRGNWTRLALTIKEKDRYCPLKMARYLDNAGQGIITICEHRDNMDLDYNLMLEVKDDVLGEYVTPIIIDPKVKNDG